jgi:hypothetical protein
VTGDRTIYRINSRLLREDPAPPVAQAHTSNPPAGGVRGRHGKRARFIPELTRLQQLVAAQEQKRVVVQGESLGLEDARRCGRIHSGQRQERQSVRHGLRTTLPLFVIAPTARSEGDAMSAGLERWHDRITLAGRWQQATVEYPA